MLFWLRKLAAALIEPLNVATLLLVAALLALFLQQRRAAAAALVLALLVLWLASAAGFSEWIRRPLERMHPITPIEALPDADAILVLGGATEPALPPRRHPELNAAADRVLHAARLFHAGKAPTLVASGGAYPWSVGERPGALRMGTLLGELGVPSDALVLETESLTTHENCANVARILGPARVLLVTSALHMPRAVATCRTAGLDVVPASTDVGIVDRRSHSVIRWLPETESLDGSSRAIREWVAHLYYRFEGYIVDPATTP